MSVPYAMGSMGSFVAIEYDGSTNRGQMRFYGKKIAIWGVALACAILSVCLLVLFIIMISSDLIPGYGTYLVVLASGFMLLLMGFALHNFNK